MQALQRGAQVLKLIKLVLVVIFAGLGAAFAIINDQPANIDLYFANPTLPLSLVLLLAVGVGIVLDDFGQGHSSVVHLTELPIKALKIDRAFVEHTREPGKQQAICAAVIAMSRELGISVIAEGVESELQVEFLKERGCDAVQGFLFTEPLPPESVLGFLSACAEVADETRVIDLTTVRQKIASRALS